MVNLLGSSNSSNISRKLSVDVAKFRKLSGAGKTSQRRYATAKRTQPSHGSKRIGVPELMRDSSSELGTPLITPTDNDFSILQMKEGMLAHSGTNRDLPSEEDVNMELDSCPLDEERDKENIPPTTRVSGCPPAPRIDTGTFDYSLILDRSHSSSFNPGMTMDFSMITSAEDSNFSSSGGQMSLDDLFTPSEIEVEGMLMDKESPQGDDRAPLGVPRAPRPDTGSWSSSTENVAPGPGAYWNPRKTWALQYREQNSHLQCFASSVTLNAQSEPGSTSEYASKRSAGWNLGLGLTLDMIAEPSYCGSSIGDISTDFTEDSFFDVDLGGYSTADSTMELLPDLATTCPLAGIAFNSADLPEALQQSGVTPRFEMLSLQDQKNVKARQRGHIAPRSGTQLSVYTDGATIAKNAPANVNRPLALYQGGFCGWTYGSRLVGATLEFSSGSGEHFSTGSRGGSCDLEEDKDVFALLPPVEL